MPLDRFSFHIDRIATPIGQMLVVADEQERLRALEWDDCEARLQRQLATQYGSGLELQPGPVSPLVRDALHAYLEGKLDAIDAIAWKPAAPPFSARCGTSYGAFPPARL